jgi:hypothetical protein
VEWPIISSPKCSVSSWIAPKHVGMDVHKGTLSVAVMSSGTSATVTLASFGNRRSPSRSR